MARASDEPAAACNHPRLAVGGACAICGGCPHEIVLNGACYACGATDVTFDPKSAEGEVVPATRLAKPRRRD
jgi:hypothetical protein